MTNSRTGRRTHGWFKAMRRPMPMEIIQTNPLAYVLMAVIAYRAKWNRSLPINGLQCGEAYLGDFATYGMTRQQYRTALKQLQKWGLITTRATSAGTIASLTNAAIFDTGVQIGSVGANQRPTSAPPTSHQQATNGSPLTKNEKSEKNQRTKDQVRFQFGKVRRRRLRMTSLV